MKKSLIERKGMENLRNGGPTVPKRGSKRIVTSRPFYCKIHRSGSPGGAERGRVGPFLEVSDEGPGREEPVPRTMDPPVPAARAPDGQIHNEKHTRKPPRSDNFGGKGWPKLPNRRERAARAGTGGHPKQLLRGRGGKGPRRDPPAGASRGHMGIKILPGDPFSFPFTICFPYFSRGSF